ncbi:MAG: serine/threonine protein kinase [Ktedonobacteraceae bacterium]
MMGDRLGQQIGNYRLEKLLGSGGFADVYLGKQVYLDSPAAIKLLRTNLTQQEIEDFRQEARTLVHLIHPHIVRVLDFGLEGNTPFLVMDYAPNGTLRHRYPRGEKLPLTTVVEYVKQIASALQYAHDEKIIHRDIKPENILLGRNYELLLSDFGIATVAHSTRTQFTQETIGTITYMAPEQIQAHPRPASDQYSLAVVVYEWLSGNPPFYGSFTETAAKHMLVPPPSLHEKVPTLAPEVEQVVLTALAKEPTQRFGSVRAFATALEQASKGEKIVLSSPAPSSQPPTVLASPLTPLPTLVATDSAKTATDAHEAKLTEPATQYAAAPQPMILGPVARSYDPVTPPPVQYQPGAEHKGLSRRAVLIAGLSAVGVVAAGGIAWEVMLQTHASSQTPTPTTSGTQGTKATTPSPGTQTTTTPGTQTTAAPAIAGLVAQDTFHRGADQTFWGTASDGQRWDGDANKLQDFSIAGGMGQIHRTANGSSFYTAVLGPSQTNAEVKVTASLDHFNPSHNNASHIGVLARYADDKNYYKVFIDGRTFFMLRRVNGHNTTLRNVPFTAQANTSYNVRFQVVGTTLNAKAWQTGTPEPANWVISATDNTFQQGRGGLRPQLEQNVTLQVSMFQETVPTH